MLFSLKDINGVDQQTLQSPVHNSCVMCNSNYSSIYVHRSAILKTREKPVSVTFSKSFIPWKRKRLCSRKKKFRVICFLRFGKIYIYIKKKNNIFANGEDKMDFSRTKFRQCLAVKKKFWNHFVTNGNFHSFTKYQIWKQITKSRNFPLAEIFLLQTFPLCGHLYFISVKYTSE